jgi:para-aminobenzoate synthetase
MRLLWRTIDGEVPTERAFEELFGEAEHAFWLDSADAPTALGQRSFMGTSEGVERCVLEYDVQQGAVNVERAGKRSVEMGSIFDVLDRELAGRAVAADGGPACGLLGGFVGYLGYECKADCGSPNVHRSDVPDAVLMFANRVVAVDHTRGETHLLALCREDEREGRAWLAHAEMRVRELLRSDEAATARPVLMGEGREGEPVRFIVGRGREQYLADIARCQVELAAGESYEICLTDQITTREAPDPFELYRLLRRVNPAPFAAYLKLGEKLQVISSSPERFLSVDRERRVQARPIKGTAPRSPEQSRDEELRRELAEDEKTYAEHLMIVDLLRNDLGRVCEVDSVRVPELMAIEPYASVHQVVSTITGVLEEQRTGVDCVRACFPGGSMTGAPKLRTMEIIDDIEREARGVYSGGLGYFGADECVDLSIVIRTIVIRPGATTIGAGGAIVMQSDAEQEFEELLLKASKPMAAIAQMITGSDDPEAWTLELEPRARATMAVAA